MGKKNLRVLRSAVIDKGRPKIEKGQVGLIKQISVCLVLTLSVVIVYAPSLHVPFLLDDNAKIVLNPDIKNWPNVLSKLIYPYSLNSAFSRNDPSRPFTYLTLALNYRISSLEPESYHIANIFFHVIAVLLVYAFLHEIFKLINLKSFMLPFFSAWLFAIHPVNLNVVTYITGRSACQATIFYILSIIMFIRFRLGLRWGLFCSAISFLLALGFNQLALTLPGAIVLTDIFFFSGSGISVPKRLKEYVIFFGLSLLYLGLRWKYFGAIGDVEAIAVCAGTLPYFLTEIVVVWKYLFLILVPKGLSFEHLYGPITDFGDWRVLVAGLAYISLAIVLIKKFRNSTPYMKLLCYSALWFLLTVSPTTSFFPTTTTMAENRIYLPSIPIFASVIYSIYEIINRWVPTNFRRRTFVSMAIMYGIVLGVVAFNRNYLYQDPIHLWSDVITKYPNLERAHKNLAVEFLKKGNYERSLDESKKALSIDPEDLDAKNNLAMAYYNQRRYDQALFEFLDILRTHPNYAPAYANAGLIYDDLRKLDKAIDAYQHAISLNPTLIEPLNNLANIYVDKGRIPEAVLLYKQALAVDPNNAQILNNYARISKQ